jgi:hypothetical protein
MGGGEGAPHTPETGLWPSERIRVPRPGSTRPPGRAGGEALSPGPTGGKAPPGLTLCWRALWERRRAHQPSPCTSRALRHRPRTIRRWCATTCCTGLTRRSDGKPLDRPGKTGHRGRTRGRRRRTRSTSTTTVGTCRSGYARIALSHRPSNGAGARRTRGSSGR